jgi:hypothetical protein
MERSPLEKIIKLCFSTMQAIAANLVALNDLTNADAACMLKTIFRTYFNAIQVFHL